MAKHRCPQCQKYVAPKGTNTYYGKFKREEVVKPFCSWRCFDKFELNNPGAVE